MPTWEYLVVTKTGMVVIINHEGQFMPTQEFLNLRGAEGWELVAIEPIAGLPQNQSLYFKRPHA